MEKIDRKPLQGVTNIIRFNWHFYVIAILFITILLCCRLFIPLFLLPWLWLVVLLIILSTVFSLGVSWYIYDGSGLYKMRWLDFLEMDTNLQIVNINAGFDETSGLLAKKYPGAALEVFDFYDPGKHTEISIERARKAYAAYPGTKLIPANVIPLKTASVDVVFVFLAAHEIRDHQERSLFFKELRRSLKEHGKIIVLEHLRDTPNFIAYNVGFLHFFSRQEWKRTFVSSQLIITKEKKITPFLSAFILQKNGIAS